MRSAGGIDKVTVSSIANIMSARDGLHVRFLKGHRAEGSHDVLKSGERLILLNPEKTEGKYWRRDILFHELWHDLSRDGGTKVLTEEIYRRSAPAFQHMVVDRYTKYYNGVSMSKFLDGKKWTEENVKAYFDTYTKISYDEVMEEVAAGTAGRVMGSKNFIKNFRDVSMLRRVFYGISDFCRAMVNKTYMTNGEETAGFMLSFKEALTFRRLYELAYTKERFHLDEGVLRAMEEIFMERDEGDSERARTKKSLSLDGENDLAEKNPKLTDADLDEYMKTGKTGHTRNRKTDLYKLGKKPILTNESEVASFMLDVIHGKAPGEVRAFAKIGSRLANAILAKDRSLDVLGNYLELHADDLRESYKRHKNPKEYGDIPLSDDDFKNIPQILDGFDGVLLTNTHNHKKEIHLYKETDDGYIKILVVASSERRSLLVTKLIGVTKEKFNRKYSKKIERDAGRPRGQTEQSEASNPPTEARRTAGALSDNSIPQVPPKVNSKKSLSLDADYMDAVKRGDMDTAQRMVDEAARKTGYTVKAYHGTPIKGITTFDPSKIGTTTDDGVFGHGFYFSTNKLTADSYATVNGKTMPVFLKAENPWWAVGHKLKDVANELDISENSLTIKKAGIGSVVAPVSVAIRSFSSHLIERGYDLIVVQHGKNDYEIVVFDNKRIKSADPVTYDDDGNVIPLSKRFDTTKSDIRYSLSLDSDIPSLSAAEVEGDANRVSWGFSWTDEKLLSNIRKVQQYFRERYPDHMVEFELDNKKKRVVVVAVQPWRFREDFSGFTVPPAKNDAYHEELTALFRSIGISDDRISEHISVFETEEEKNETIERAKKKNEGRRLKVYHKQEVAKSIEGVLSNVLSPIVGPSKLMGKKKRALITRLWQELNRAKASEREKLAERFAEELIVSTVYDDYEVNAEYEQMLVDGTVESYEMLNEYRKKLDVSAVIENAKGSIGVEKVNVLRKRWGAGKDGISPRQAFYELQAQGFLVDLEAANNEADILIALNEEYERLKERTSMRRELLPLAAMSEERLSAIKSELKTSLLTFFNEGGKDTKYGKLARRYQEQGKYYIET